MPVVNEALENAAEWLKGGQTYRHSVPRLIAEISHRITLLPGTVILTGAPGRVEGVQDAPLAGGDHIDVQCDAIGTLVNVVR